MKTSFVLFAIFSVAFSRPEEPQEISHEDNLTNMMNEAVKRVLQTLDTINKAAGQYDELIEDRLECLKWECQVQEETVNKTVTESVFKGMLKNKQMTNFQCIGNAAKETFDKLNVIRNRIPEESETFKTKALANVTPFKLITGRFTGYVGELYTKKREELEKAKDENGRKKVIAEAKQKIELLKDIVEQISTQLRNIKNKFFEDYINYAYNTENNLRKTQRDGVQKIQKCVS